MIVDMHRDYRRWFSHPVGRDMEVLVFGHAGARVLVFPTRAGRFFDYENWGLVDALRGPLEGGQLQLYCVDSIDAESLYCFHVSPHERLRRHLGYERYLLEELLPFSEWKNSNPFLIAHGCSMGAYHAANMAFRHPDRFHKVVALSGRYDLTADIGAFPRLLDACHDETVYFNTPSHFVPNLTDWRILEQLRRMQIVLAVGQEDAFAENNRQLSHTLERKGVAHTFDVWEGEAHRARYWRSMVPKYL